MDNGLSSNKNDSSETIKMNFNNQLNETDCFSKLKFSLSVTNQLNQSPANYIRAYGIMMLTLLKT